MRLSPGTPLAARLWSRVLLSPECWEWQGYRHALGYGQIRVARKSLLVHRVAWELANGRTLEPGEVVRHACDNPPCCRPSHLDVGVQFDNVRDMFARNRQHSKLTTESVRLLRADAASGTSMKELAVKYGVSPVTARQVVARVMWRHA